MRVLQDKEGLDHLAVTAELLTNGLVVTGETDEECIQVDYAQSPPLELVEKFISSYLKKNLSLLT